MKSYWTEPLIDLHLGAKARLAGVNRSKATNPTFDLSGFRLRFSYAQTATYILVFGDKVSGTVNKTWIEYLFGRYPSVIESFCSILTYPLDRKRTAPGRAWVGKAGNPHIDIRP